MFLIALDKFIAGNIIHIYPINIVGELGEFVEIVHIP